MLLLYIDSRLSDESLGLLKQAGWTTLAVQQIPHPEGRPPAHNFMDQYTKLSLFEYVEFIIKKHLSDHSGRLEEYEQIFYMDADMMVVRPFPEIWSFPVPLAATRDVRMGW